MSETTDRSAAGEAAENPSDDQIAQRAYLIWEARGCPDTDGSEDWQTAYAELVAENAAKATRERPLKKWFGKLRGRAASL